MKNKRSRIWKVSSTEFKNIVMNANSYSDIANYFNYSKNSSIYNMIKERMNFEKIPLSIIEEAQKKQRLKQINNLILFNETPLEDILVENSSYTNTKCLKEKLLKKKLLTNNCYECGIGSEWNGKPLSLQLDHKNGINNDNRLENLRLLCPNCHSQTPTFCGRHRKVITKCTDCGIKINKKSTRCIPCSSKIINKINAKVQNRPSRTELIELILTKPFLQIGSDYGVSDNAIRKWCKTEELPYRKRDIELMREELETEIKKLV